MTEVLGNWDEWREFKGVDLTQSFILSWEWLAGSLQLDIDLSILPQHPFFEQPRPSEKGCFRPAHIAFPQCSEVWESASPGITSPQESVRALRGGRIHNLQRTGEGRYRITGQFGSVGIVAERPMIRLKDPTI